MASRALDKFAVRSLPTGRLRARTVAALLLLSGLAVGSRSLHAQDRQMPADFIGDWVPADAECESPVRFRVGEEELTLINGEDSETYGDLALPASYFGPEYTGMSRVVIPEFDTDQPFTAFFNVDEVEGVARVDIYYEMAVGDNAALAAIQAKAKALSERFPLNQVPLKKCVADAAAPVAESSS